MDCYNWPIRKERTLVKCDLCVSKMPKCQPMENQYRVTTVLHWTNVRGITMTGECLSRTGENQHYLLLQTLIMSYTKLSVTHAYTCAYAYITDWANTVHVQVCESVYISCLLRNYKQQASETSYCFAYWNNVSSFFVLTENSFRRKYKQTVKVWGEFQAGWDH